MKDHHAASDGPMHLTKPMQHDEPHHLMPGDGHDDGEGMHLQPGHMAGGGGGGGPMPPMGGGDNDADDQPGAPPSANDHDADDAGGPPMGGKKRPY